MRMEQNLRAPYEPSAAFTTAFSSCQLVAILRDVRPAEVVAHGRAIYDAGFRIIEVPLNSPAALESICALRNTLPADALIGAGTVLTVQHVCEVEAAGGNLIVMPHADPHVIVAAKLQGLVCVPGVATLTEAFDALRNGPDALKMFPAEQLGAEVTRAWRAVIPSYIPLLPVGGVKPDNMGTLLLAGASGFGLGSALYCRGQDPAATRANALAFVTGLRATHRGNEMQGVDA
ncbi:2-dehydro-3-deoxy-6-phosphogalactonate aldolase [Paraburkholderia sp. JHI869]|uniref:2-dehydro-3-deoxy-6-phosphogalactonate aldolase n=1 Tax=Paraburkholderia sp. JHI869 TaxID=3112959 RepID=UPI003173B95B